MVALLALALAVGACGAPPDAGTMPLRVYNWSDYIAPGTLEAFEAETGIHVTYDVFDSNEVLEAKLLSGASGYDVVVPTSEFLGRQVPAGVFQPLDRRRLANHRHLDPALMARLEEVDPGNRHGVPYLWGTTGIGHNVERVRAVLGADAPVDSLRLVFDPAHAAPLAECGIAMLDAPREVFSAALQYLGIDPNTDDPAHYQRDARRLLEGIRPYIRYFHSSQYINDLANGEVCVALGWSGDILQAADRAREAGKPFEVAYRTPQEGALVWFDLLAIPAGARNVEDAHRFIDYLLRPDVIARITRHVNYANANLAADALLAPEVRANPGIYPPRAARQRFYVNAVVSPKMNRIITRTWTAVKSGR